jgi:phosphodiesterase/alkaline phosphatase D-like protein
VNAMQPDLFLFLGDTIYGDWDGEYDDHPFRK